MSVMFSIEAKTEQENHCNIYELTKRISNVNKMINNDIKFKMMKWFVKNNNFISK